MTFEELEAIEGEIASYGADCPFAPYEPTTESDKRRPAVLVQFVYDLINAAKTINHHVDRADYKPNKYRLARLEILDARRLAELSFADKRAGEYLDALRQIAMSSKNGWKDRIMPNVKEYDK